MLKGDFELEINSDKDLSVEERTRVAFKSGEGPFTIYHKPEPSRINCAATVYYKSDKCVAVILGKILRKYRKKNIPYGIVQMAEYAMSPNSTKPPYPDKCAEDIYKLGVFYRDPQRVLPELCIVGVDKETKFEYARTLASFLKSDNLGKSLEPYWNIYHHKNNPENLFFSIDDDDYAGMKSSFALAQKGGTIKTDSTFPPTEENIALFATAYSLCSRLDEDVFIDRRSIQEKNRPDY